MIRIDNLSYKYNKNINPTLKDITFNIESKNIYILLGLNGCGKTTLIKTLVGLNKPTSGNIYIDDVNLQDLSIISRSKIISYVPQKNLSNDEVLIFDYLSFAFINRLKLYESVTKEQKDKIYSLAKEFNIEHLLDKQLGEISGGERQIVSICKAVLQDTQMIVLDEPTSSLDLKNQDMILSILKKLVENGKTILFSTHNPNHALKLGAKVVLLNNGSISKAGSASDIVTLDNLKSIYGERLVYSKDLEYDEISFK